MEPGLLIRGCVSRMLCIGCSKSRGVKDVNGYWVETHETGKVGQFHGHQDQDVGMVTRCFRSKVSAYLISEMSTPQDFYINLC